MQHSPVTQIGLWPNVCNNAPSAVIPVAQGGRGAPAVLAYYGRDVHLTGRWLDLHEYVRAPGRNEGPVSNLARGKGTLTPVGGWDLVGCQVEEYPFGNSYPADPGAIAQYNDRPTLRLIPQAENANHGSALGHFIRYTQLSGHGANGVEKNVVYCVQITGGNQPSDYCINSGASCNNKRAAAYGPAFVLVNDATLADQQAASAAGLTNEQRWDKWSDGAAGRRFIHTISATVINSVTLPVEMVMPPQFAPTTAPGDQGHPQNWPIIAPGQKIYTGTFPNGAWVKSYTVSAGWANAGAVITVVIPRNAPRVPPNNGTNYRWDAVPMPSFPSKRDLESELTLHVTSPQNASEQDSRLFGTLPETRILTPRQATGGSWLDADIYSDVLQCPVGDHNVFGDNQYATYPPGAGTIVSSSIKTSGGTKTTTTAKSTTKSSENPPEPTGIGAI